MAESPAHRAVPPSGPAANADAAGPGWLAFVLLVLGNVLLAFGGLLVRLADTGPVATGFWRLALAAPILVVIALRAGQRMTGFSWQTWALMIGGGLFFAADLAAWHLGLVRTKLANATLFGNSASLLLVLWGMVVLRHAPRPIQLVAIALALGGGALLMGESIEFSARNLEGDVLSLVAGALYTGYLLTLQRARGGLGNWSVLAVSTLASVLPMLGFTLLMGERLWPDDWRPLLVLALTSQVAGQGLLVYALPYFRPLVVGLALLVQPAIAAMIGWLTFGETLGMAEILGMVGISLALVLVRWPDRKNTRAGKEGVPRGALPRDVAPDRVDG